MFEAPRQAQSAAVGTANVGVNFAPAPGIDFQEILAALWRGKTTILWTTAASLLLAVLFVLAVPHRYTAVTQILIDPTDLHAVGNDLTPTNQANDAAVLQVESQVRVLTSDSVLLRVVKAEALDRDPEFARPPSPLRSLMLSFGLGGEASAADPAVAALNALKRAVQVKRSERTYVVDVSVTSRDREKAARLANAIAQAYLAEQTDVRANAARQVSQSLSARLNELKNRVREAEDRVEAFKQRNNILGSSGQLVNEQQLTELNNQLGVARARTAAAKARLDQVQQVQLSKNEIGAFPEAVQSQTITALRSQYAEVMRREAEQMTSLGARHPAVIEIQAEAERLRHMIEDEVHRIALSARSEYESARANEGTLAANLETLKGNAIATNEAMVTLRELDRDVQASRAVYESFLVRARETGEQERLDTKNIRVISRADVPLRRSFPPSNSAACSQRHSPRHRRRLRHRHHARELRPRAAPRQKNQRGSRQLRQYDQRLLASRGALIFHSGAGGPAKRRCVVRFERRRESEIAVCRGTPQGPRGVARGSKSARQCERPGRGLRRRGRHGGGRADACRRRCRVATRAAD